MAGPPPTLMTIKTTTHEYVIAFAKELLYRQGAMSALVSNRCDGEDVSQSRAGALVPKREDEEDHEDEHRKVFQLYH